MLLRKNTSPFFRTIFYSINLKFYNDCISFYFEVRLTLQIIFFLSLKYITRILQISVSVIELLAFFLFLFLLFHTLLVCRLLYAAHSIENVFFLSKHDDTHVRADECWLFWNVQNMKKAYCVAHNKTKYVQM